jgi:hypothetical protein
MSKLLEFHCITYDTKTLHPGYCSNIEFFKDVSENASSVTDNDETKIVKWFFEYGDCRELLFKELYIQNYQYKLATKTCEVSNHKGRPGDLDIILFDRNRPQESIEIEVKKIKAVIEESGRIIFDGGGDMTEKFRTGVSQANGVCENIGFCNSYLLIFMEVDGRLMKKNNFFHRGLNNYRELYSFPCKEQLSPGIGIIFVELIQPIDADKNMSAETCICVPKIANSSYQDTGLTAKLIHYFNNTTA